MVGFFKCLGQGKMTENDWTNRNGEKVKIQSVPVAFADAENSYVGEASDYLAKQLNEQPLVVGKWYSISFICIAKKGTKNDPDRWFMSCRIKEIIV